MHAVELIYLITTFTSVFTALPQLKQLWRMKNSDEFSLFSWVAWCLSQIAALFYSITIHSIPYLLVNIAWISFYLLMISLIIKFRNNTSTHLVTEEVNIH
jgi:uncharacterized protein with PQ loop repeat